MGAWLRKGEKLPLLESNVLSEATTEGHGIFPVPRFHRVRLREEEPMVIEGFAHDPILPLCQQRRQQYFFLHREMGPQFAIEEPGKLEILVRIPLVGGSREAPGPHESPVVFGRKSLKARIPFHRGPISANRSPAGAVLRRPWPREAHPDRLRA